MITVDKKDNYSLVSVRSNNFDFDVIKELQKAITVEGPDVVVDITKLDPNSVNEGWISSLSELSELGSVVWFCGDEHYEKYNQNEELSINIVPTLPEAEDMLFMVKMEKELGGEDFEI